MGDVNHGNIKWDSQQSTGVEDQKLLCLVQDNFLTQHVLEPTRAARVLDIVLSSQKEFIDNVVIHEPTQGILMAEELNMHFSSVFTREDTSSLPVPETKFEGSEGERLGQLVVTPEVVANKINNMKENKSPGVDGIAPKILKETVEQICTPLAHVFNMSLQEGIVPLEWKEANIIPLFKKGSRNKSVNYRPVSLTSVICKVLETIIRDHMMDFLIKHKLINPSQHGFLKARSCLTNLLCFLRK